ncbi:MAG: hypothetical protein VKO64_01190 [Candidatus Sericytochromatia bacterium]|nr:hypothetical protein [Candidatus Sericytochromatia bacterium]
MAMTRFLPILLALTVLLPACRTPGPAAAPVRQDTSGAPQTAVAPVAVADQSDGVAIRVQPAEKVSGSGIALPEVLKDQPFGLVSVAIAWPQVSAARQVQAIPTQARSLRLRLIGSDGKVRLSDFFFRTSTGAREARTYVLKAETGMLVEVRAYLETKEQLDAGPAPGQTNIFLNEGGAEPPYNQGQASVDREYNMVGRRVLAEGLKANFQVVLFSRSAVSVTVDSSQLVAGIGGAPSYGFGGDPYFPNFVSRARFAELANPRNLYLDKWGGRRRLFFNVNPIFEVQEPKERHILMMLDQAGLEAVQTDDQARSDGVLKHVMGGARLLEPGDLEEQPLRNKAFVDFGLSTVRRSPSAGTPDELLFISVNGDNRAVVGVKAGTIDEMREAKTSLKPVDLGSTGLEKTAVDLSGFASGKGGAGYVVADSRAVYVSVDAKAPGVLAAGAPSPTATPDPDVDVVAKDVVLGGQPIVAVAGMTASPSIRYAFATGTALFYGVGDKLRQVLGSAGATQSLEDASSATGVDRFSVRIASIRDVVASPSSASVLYVAADDAILRLSLPSSLGAISASSPSMEIRKPGFDPQSLAVSSDGQRLAALAPDGSVHILDVGAGPGDVSTWTEATQPDVDATLDRDPTGNLRQEPRRIEFVPTGSAGDLLVTFIHDKEGGPARLRAFTVGSASSRELVDSRSVYDSRIGDGQRISETLFSETEGGGHIDKPAAIAVTPSGSIVVADPVIRRIRHLDMPGTTQGILESLVKSEPDADPPFYVLDAPEAVDVDEHGTVFVGDTNNYRICIWKPSCGFGASGLATIAGTGQQGYNLDNINAMLVQLGSVTRLKVERNSASGRRRVFFIDGKRVRMLSPRDKTLTAPDAACGGPFSDAYFQYIVSTIAGDGQGTDKTNAAQFGLTKPSWLEVDGRGYVYVADGKTIYRIDPEAGTIVPVFSTEDAAITSFVIDDTAAPLLREIYYTRAGNQTIRKLILED